MDIAVGETTTHALVKAYSILSIDDFTMPVKAKTARITEAEVYWTYQDGAWVIGFVQLSGPIVRKSDGADSTQTVSFATYPAGMRSYGEVTPGEILDFALANAPDWTPTISESGYSRTPGLPSSL
ncbi:hypothetical protein M2152_001287 [Microbacteriaceae bacterium SG_E_30_P1]|uniref:Uncharacterized protein n=1 Tax=Antiquaquibacter oligotrophicus TaxID=2880260 RepID=A0ABT6KMY8_9MICO|nr:hypothetical protein [Antiquaquibacter oligotrophicus]MDH6181105.1 hypothetical protein [Antiquaquibacter oligotrophicus]UDF13197.1 hypothetical protein LH407_13715 [Antiquaquibacter oligotrophicus]